MSQFKTRAGCLYVVSSSEHLATPSPPWGRHGGGGVGTPATGSVGHSWGLSAARVGAAAVAAAINTTIMFMMLLRVPLVVSPLGICLHPPCQGEDKGIRYVSSAGVARTI